MVNVNHSFWRDRSVWISGHTGFKGGWLALWLHELGARIHGFSLEPPTHPCLFDVTHLKTRLSSDVRADLADLSSLKRSIDEAQPEVVFHLAAQPLVRESYRNPLATLNCNIMGTAHVLEAIRGVESIQSALLITTDKVYQNQEWSYPYREVDPLGGHDPYSASKAAAEIVVASYRASFFAENAVFKAQIASVRAGNVIGGGDWAADRLVPDCLRAFAKGEPVRLRFPHAVRPWQHVLEPLSGYLFLAERLGSQRGEGFAKAWNFGPDIRGNATVGAVAELVARLWGEQARVEFESSSGNPHEAGLLHLDSSMAYSELGWRPRWSLQEALSRTVEWHRAWTNNEDMAAVSLSQIREYMGVDWL
ncbi:MAG: CDP-glucose 4,6-dehydratase [Magnetococcales bacterium]|nr:CDP-glucose 4,6-dehydratase [Magnetococcales bacterium]